MTKKNILNKLNEITALSDEDRVLFYCEKLVYYINDCRLGTQLTVSTLSDVVSCKDVDINDLYKALNILCSPMVNVIDSEFIFYPIEHEDYS